MKSLSHQLHRFLQILATTGFILFTLITLKHLSNDRLFWVIGATSLASSATILREALPFVIALFSRIQYIDSFTLTMIMIFIAMFITLYLFSLLHITHPPATGIALAMAVHEPGYLVFILLLLLTLVLAVIKTLFKRYLKDIVD